MKSDPNGSTCYPLFSRPRCYKDVQRPKGRLLVAWYEEIWGDIRRKMAGLSEDKGRTSAANWRIATNRDPIMEMGAYFHGFRSWFT